MQKDGLGLIVHRVAGRDRGRPDLAREPPEECVAVGARVVLVLRRSCGAPDAQRRADVIREIRDEGSVSWGGARARAVIEVRDVEDEAEFLAELSQDERKRDGICATRDREDDRARAEDGMLARERADD
jgi:hypothetical protein